MLTVQISKLISVTQRSLRQSAELAEAVPSGLQKRFGNVINFAEGSKGFATAAVCHPTFKLRWVPKEKMEWARICFTDVVVQTVTLHAREAGSPRQKNKTPSLILMKMVRTANLGIKSLSGWSASGT